MCVCVCVCVCLVKCLTESGTALLYLYTVHPINVFWGMRQSGYRKSTDTCKGVTNVMYAYSTGNAVGIQWK